MNMTLEHSLLLIAGTLTALVAGLFFGFSVAVNGGLHRLKNSEYVAAMQSINQVIQNPVFLLSFFGPVLFLPWSTFVHKDTTPTRFFLLLGASLLYIIGTFVLTIVGNVPLNRKLERFKLDGASDEEIAYARTGFEQPWNRRHTVRTAASIAATILIFAACLSS